MKNFVNYIKMGNDVKLIHRTRQHEDGSPFEVEIVFSDDSYNFNIETASEEEEKIIKETIPDLYSYFDDNQLGWSIFSVCGLEEQDFIKTILKFSEKEWVLDGYSKSLSFLQKYNDLKEMLLRCADVCQESWGDMFHFDLSYNYNKDFRKYLKNCLSKEIYTQLKSKTPLFKELGVFEVLDSLDTLLVYQSNAHPQDTEAFNLFLDYCMENKKFRKELKKELNDFLREVEQEQEDNEIDELFL